MLNILVIHGYVQSAATVAANTTALRNELSSIATLYYAEGPPVRGGGGSRPWWILDGHLEHNTSSGRWEETVKWWSDHLSENVYDGVIGLSQGGAMTALLVSMLAHPERVPGFTPTKHQPIKFAILCSGFASHFSPHKEIYGIPEDLPTLHTVDDNDYIVPASATIELQKMCKTSTLVRHREGHAVPVRGEWPKVFRKFIEGAIKTPAAAPATEDEGTQTESVIDLTAVAA